MKWVAYASFSTLECEEREAHPRRAWKVLGRGLAWDLWLYIRGGGSEGLASRAIARREAGAYDWDGS